MDRKTAIEQANQATYRARALAYEAEQKARTFGLAHEVAPLAAAGALWADTARAYTQLATVLPETPAADDAETETTDG